MHALFAKILAFFMSILAIFGLAKPTDKPVVDVDIPVVVIENTEIKISVSSNPSTGYQWMYFVDGDAIEFTSENYVSSSTSPDVVGAGGTQTFVFNAVKPGKVTVTLSYERAWEDGNAGSHKLVFNVSNDMTVKQL